MRACKVKTGHLCSEEEGAHGHWDGQHGGAEPAPVVRSCPHRRPGIPDVGGLLPAALDPGAGGVGQAGLAGLRPGLGSTRQGAWLLLRAIQLWAPFPGNDPDGARACMRQLYTLVKLRYGEPADPERAAVLEIEWWRVHRERQRSSSETSDELVESVTRLYSCVFGAAEAEVRTAAAHRARAMDLSDQWVREGCQPDSPLLPLEHAALVRAYAALLAAVHHDQRR